MTDLKLSDRSFLEQNQQEFAELLTFIDFAQQIDPKLVPTRF
jgi:hypothetical protein